MSDLKITKAGYVYLCNIKVSEQKLTPVSIHIIAKKVPEMWISKLQCWVKNNWKMSQLD